MNFTGKTALVTGGTRGIGKAIADLLVELGCHTIITGTKVKEDSLSAAGKGLEFLQLDLLSDESFTRFSKKIQSLEKIDILINNAGINKIAPVDEIADADWDNIIRVNLSAPMKLSRLIAPMMKKNGGGKILNMSSVFGTVAREKRNAYAASKAGLIGLTKASALDLAPHNILVNALLPGFTATELTFSILSEAERHKLIESIPLKRFADVKEIAQTAAFLCSDFNTYITGQSIIIDGGFVIQ